MSPQRFSPRVILNLLLIVFIAAAPIGLALAASSQPQAASNLLTNPGFEPPYSQQGAGDVHIASGWTGWWVTPGNNYPSSCPSGSPPTCKPYQIPVFRETQPQNAREIPRARSGDSQQWGTRYAISIAGVYQHVTGITPGTRLRFTAYLQGFNCTDNNGCFGSGTYGASYQPGSMNTRIGIDPTGGADPFSTNIVWSGFQNPLDVFSLHQVEAVAQGDAVTVFVWASPDTPELHTDVFLDDASLTIAGEGTSAATAEPTLLPGTQQPAPTAPSGTGTYTIQEGDTLFAIALQFNLTLDQLLALNPDLTRDSVLQVGQVINVGTPGGTPAATAPATPPATQPPAATPQPSTTGPITYTVQEGDTLSAIALEFDLTLDQLLALNNITKDTPLNVGQVLTVGVAAATPTPTTPPTITPTLAITVPTPAATPTPAVSASGLCLSSFDDLNGNGKLDSGEPPVAGTEFVVKDKNGNVVTAYTSDAQTGPHCLNNLADGQYTLEATPPVGRIATSDSTWSLALLAGTSVNVAFGNLPADAVVTATPEAAAAPTATVTAAPASNGRSSAASLALLAGGALLLLAAVALFFGLRTRRR